MIEGIPQSQQLWRREKKKKKIISNIVFVLYRKQNMTSFLTGVQGRWVEGGDGLAFLMTRSVI